MDLFKQISSLVYAELAGLKLILSLLSTYPISLIYQLFFINSSVNIKCIYFILTGLSLSCFNYGSNTIHLLITILIVYCALKINSKSIIINSFNFLFTMSYLLAGYFYTQTSTYGFHWTIPHCVLTLRLIAISFNLFDGHRCKLKSKSCEHEDHLDKVPNFLEFLAHCLFPCSFLVGPQFEFYVFHSFIRRNDQTYKIVWKNALSKLITGSVYFTIFMIGTSKIKPDYMVTNDFLNSSFLFKMTVIAIVAKVNLMKYIFVWLFTEGGLILSGLTYDSRNKRAYNVSNVDIVLYETTDKFDGLIKSFNITTNNWTAKYIYKRLKFMNSKALSHLTSLMFLAVWHGQKSGYYMTFLMEFLTVINEKESSSVYGRLQSKYPLIKRVTNNFFVEQIIYFLLKLNIFYSLAYSFIPFVLLTHKRWMPVMQSTYYYLFLQYFTILILNKLITIVFLKPSPLTDKKVK